MEDETVKLTNNKANLDIKTHPDNKKNVLIITIVAVAVGLSLLLGGYVWFKSVSKDPVDNSNQEAAQEAAKGVLPSLSSNPLENKPNVNPVDNTNPIKEIKTNPFE